MWKIDISVPMDKAAYVLDALEASYLSASCFEDSRNPRYWIVSLYTDQAPDTHALTHTLTPIAAQGSFPLPPFEITPVEEKDWVTESQNYFSPFVVGKFYIHTSWHNPLSIPADTYPMEIDPAQAFGTGTHDTTQGCLLALSKLADSYTPHSILDMGTGTGILAIAARYLWPDATIIAADYDQKAVDIAAKNSERFSIRCVHADSFHHTAITPYAPYDLILANILAIPLIAMAPDIRPVLKPAGKAILSGFYDWQMEEVTTAYKEQGLHVIDTMLRNQWGILTFA